MIKYTLLLILFAINAQGQIIDYQLPADGTLKLNIDLSDTTEWITFSDFNGFDVVRIEERIDVTFGTIVFVRDGKIQIEEGIKAEYMVGHWVEYTDYSTNGRQIDEKYILKFIPN